VALCVLCIGVLASAQPRLRPAPNRTSETIWQQLYERCELVAREYEPPYPWPLAPFYTQHPVRGYFGDPRTVIESGDGGAFSFHNGVDITAWTGNRVYPVVSGMVAKVSSDRVVVQASDNRRFQYIHVLPLVRVGEPVVVSTTVLGTVRHGWNHVHLSEIREDCSVNPLMPGHLTPYRDRTVPVVDAISIQNPARRPMSPSDLTGKVRIVASAFDRPALPSPPPWGSLPVAPALVQWKLTTLTGQTLVAKTAADFRYGEPLRRQFCTVYAPGTEQNFAAVAGTFHWGKAGRYLFDLTPNLLDVARFAPGRYRLTVTAADTAGNVGSRSEVVRVRAGPAPAVATVPDTRCGSLRAGTAPALRATTRRAARAAAAG
jgi:hypothetical protein